MSSSESLFSDSVPSPEQARHMLRMGSGRFMRKVWPDWVATRPLERTDGERAVVVGVMNDVLRYGAMVARGLDIQPLDACKASYEAQTGKSADVRQSVRSVVSGFVSSVHKAEEERIAAAERAKAEAEPDHASDEESVLLPDDPRALTTSFEVRASGLIVASTRQLHGVLSDLEGGQTPPQDMDNERNLRVFGDYFNAMGYAALMNFNYHMSDDLQI